MTGYMDTNMGAIYRNTNTVIKKAEHAKVSSVIFTGKGEPFLNQEFLFPMLYRFKDFPTEIQTNGRFLENKLREDLHHDRYMKQLIENHVNIISFSIDNMDELISYSDMFAALDKVGIIVRVCINVSSKLKVKSFKDLFWRIKSMAVRQLLIRHISIPEKVIKGRRAEKTISWINTYAPKERYYEMHEEFIDLYKTNDGSIIRVLPHGDKVLDVEELSVCFSDYCIQEINNTKDIRSLIWMEDGHVYTAWDKPSSILF